MIKISSLADWNLQQPGAQLAKFASCGLQGGDYSRMIKLAGESFASRARDLVIEPGLEPVYQTALASTESHGYNRNGDGYSQAMLAKRANTFVTHGRLYRNHKAKDPNRSYGIIKMAEYDPRMGIVHIIGGLFKDAETARKFGGGNPADEEQEALAKYGSYPVSQGSSILGGDKCVICGKVSTDRKDYCVAKSAGGDCDLYGCRDGLSKIAEDGRHQALDNPDGIFHDCSKVGFGADRQAFAHKLAPGDIEKAASGEPVPGIYGGAWLADIAAAEAPSFPPADLGIAASDMWKRAQIFAQIESRVRQELEKASESERDYYLGLVPANEVTTLAKEAASHQESQWKAAADLSAALEICVPPEQFFKAAGLSDGEVAAAMSHVPTMFSQLLRKPEHLSALVKKAAASAALHTTATRPTFSKMREHTMDNASIHRRALEKLASGSDLRIIKSQATLSKAASDALDSYACYRLRALGPHVVSQPEYVELVTIQSHLY